MHIQRPFYLFIFKYYDVSIMCAQYQGRRGGGSKNYRGPAVRKGARCPTMLDTFLSSSVVLSIVDFTN